jgi:DNA-binding GntR family transcriptional regulator
MTDILLQNTSRGITNRYVSLSEEIRHLLIDAFIEGELVPGTRINDVELAQKLGVSRTPVREALRGLQTLGIIETLPARITRVVTLNAQEFEHAKIVWASLYRILLTDTIEHITAEHITQMTEMCNKFTPAHNDKLPTHTFRFFETLSSLTKNTFLRESIHTAACRIRLGHHNTHSNTKKHLTPTRAQAQQFLNALIHKNLTNAHHILETITTTPHHTPALNPTQTTPT